MFHELINLLPRERVHKLRRDYFIRLATVAVVVLALVVVISGVMLVPAYLALKLEASNENSSLASIQNSLGSTQEHDVDVRLKALQGDTTYLKHFGTLPAATAAIRAVLLVPRPGVSLKGFTFAAPTKGTNSQLQISGTATTREALQSYDQALAALPFVSNANLPIEAYAKETDIDFTITLTGSLTP